MNSIQAPMMNELSELTHNISRIPLHENMLSFSVQMNVIRLHIEVKCHSVDHTFSCLSVLTQAVYLGPYIYK